MHYRWFGHLLGHPKYNRTTSREFREIGIQCLRWRIPGDNRPSLKQTDSSLTRRSRRPAAVDLSPTWQILGDTWQAFNAASCHRGASSRGDCPGELRVGTKRGYQQVVCFQRCDFCFRRDTSPTTRSRLGQGRPEPATRPQDQIARRLWPSTSPIYGLGVGQPRVRASRGDPRVSPVP